MASSSELLLQSAISAVERAFARLDAAAHTARHDREQAASQRDAAQAEISQTWQTHSAKLELELSEAQLEAELLREDNARLATQLQKLQSDYLSLQQVAGATLGRLDASVAQLDP